MIPPDSFGAIDQRFLSKSLGLLSPPTPLSVTIDTTLDDTIEMLQQNNIGCVTVNDSTGKLAGIFSERDVLLRVIQKGIDLGATSVEEVMTANPKTAEMTTTIAFALAMMSHGGYRHLPIVDEKGYAVGIISVKNIVDYIVQSFAKDLERV